MSKSEEKICTELENGYVSLLAVMPDPVVYLDLEKRCLFVNQAFEKKYKALHSEWRGKPIEEILGLELSQRIDACLMDIKEGRERSFAQRSFVNQRPFNITRYQCIPHIDRAGDVDGFFVHLREEAFKDSSGDAYPSWPATTSFPFHSEANLLKASRPSGLGFWSLEIPSMRVLLSEKVSADWELNHDEFAETMDQAIERVYEEDREKVRAAFRAALDRTADYWVEYRVLRPDNEIMWIESRGELLMDENGNAYRLMGTIHDITNRKNIEQLLLESEYRFRTLADFMPQIVWTADAKGRMDYCNKNGLDYTGMSMAEVLGNDFQCAMEPEDFKKTSLAWKDCVVQGQPFEIECRLLRKSDKTYRWHLTRGLFLKDSNGDIVKWLGTSTDIHEQKHLLEDLERAKSEAEKGMAMKAAFIANMSHEIRTPLTAILGFTKLLSNPEVAPAMRARYFEIIDRNGKALSKIIDDILDISKFEAGKFEIESIDFRLDQLLDEIISMFANVARDKGIFIRVSMVASPHRQLRSDPSRLRQILINIVGNAVKFTEQGGVAIDVSTELYNNNDVRIRISVKDSGTGLTKEQARRLFEPFNQADESTTRKYGGSGLGLAISRRFARALGGDVFLESYALKQGCTFVITVDAELALREKALESTQAAISFPNEELQDSEQTIVALVVDDAVENQYLLSEILRHQGIAVELASNGQEAIDTALKNCHDFILMDMQMPLVDGFEATRELRRQGYARPIIALTALAMKEDELRILECGCDAHLTKPVDFKLLFDTIFGFIKPQWVAKS